jgi:hypothetical protein
MNHIKQSRLPRAASRLLPWRMPHPCYPQFGQKNVTLAGKSPFLVSAALAGRWISAPL